MRKKRGNGELCTNVQLRRLCLRTLMLRTAFVWSCNCSGALNSMEKRQFSVSEKIGIALNYR
jgi:hypothetical protein